jgi:hypothetical protein
MAFVQRRDLVLVQAFDHREDGCIHESEVSVLVAVAKPPDSPVVVDLEIRDPIRAGQDVLEQGYSTPAWRRA